MEPVDPMLLVLAASLVALVAMAWYGVFHVLPSTQLSRYRYRVWTARDRLVDAVLEGEIPDDEITRNLIEAMEGAIREARWVNWVTFTTVALRNRRDWDEQTRTAKDKEAIGCEHYTPEQKDLYAGVKSAYNRATTRKIMFGSLPSAVCTIAVSLALFIVLAVKRHHVSSLDGATPSASWTQRVIERAMPGRDLTLPRSLLDRRRNGDGQSMASFAA